MLTLPAFPDYDILSRESIVLTIPPHVVRTRQRPSGHLELEIAAVAGSAARTDAVLLACSRPQPDFIALIRFDALLAYAAAVKEQTIEVAKQTPCAALSM